MTIRQLLKKLPARKRTDADGEKAFVIDSSILPSASSTTQDELEKREYKGAIELMKLFFQGKA